MTYHVMCQRQFYNSSVSFKTVSFDGRNPDNIADFDSFEAAKKYIKDEESGDYVLSHGEYAGPIYIIIDAPAMQIYLAYNLDENFDWDLFVSECDDCGKCEDCIQFKEEEIEAFLLSNNLLA